MAVSFEERRKKQAQTKARLQADEAAAGLIERKARHHRMIELGAKVEKHAIASMDDATREGALDEQDRAAKDLKTLQRWKKVGEEKLARAAQILPLTITFSGVVPTAAIEALREKRFRLNRLRGEWEGKADLVTAAALADPYGGKVQIIGQAEEVRLGIGRPNFGGTELQSAAE